MLWENDAPQSSLFSLEQSRHKNLLSAPPPLLTARCLARTGSPHGKIRFIEPGVVVLKSKEKYFILWVLVLSHRHGFSERSPRRFETIIFPIRITTVWPSKSLFNFFDAVGDSRTRIRESVMKCEECPCEEGALGSSVTYDRSPMAIAALGPPERTSGLVPSLLHSVFSAFPLRSMHAANDI